jgi:PKD repeat protein
VHQTKFPKQCGSLEGGIMMKFDSFLITKILFIALTGLILNSCQTSGTAERGISKNAVLNCAGHAFWDIAGTTYNGTPSEYAAGGGAQFRAFPTVISSTPCPINRYIWNFVTPSGTSQQFITDSATPVINFRLSVPGNYSVNLVVEVIYATNPTATTIFTVSRNFKGVTSPTASFTASATDGPAPLTVSFDGSASQFGGATPNYKWYSSPASSLFSTAQQFSYTFNQRGIYTVSLYAQNASGVSVVSKTIQVGLSPVARGLCPRIGPPRPGSNFQASRCTVNIPYTEQFPPSITASATQSIDSDGSIIKYDWYTDGRYLGSGSSITCPSTCSDLSLTVTDNDGFTGRQSVLYTYTAL